jgi:hypothetical protein
MPTLDYSQPIILIYESGKLMWSLVCKNNPSKTLCLKYCQTKRDLLELPRLVKKAMENKCWKEKDGTHTFRKVDMCKWQMGDPET